MKTQLKSITLCFYSLFIVCGSASAETKSPVVFVEAAKTSELFESLTYPVRVSSTIQAPVIADFDGTVESVKARIGQEVRKGQSLGFIRNTDPVYDYAAVALTSPIRGQVASIDVTEGSRVVKGQKLLTLIDAAKHQLSMEVPAADLPMLRTDMTGIMSFSGVEEPITVQIHGISPLVDPISGTATVELTVPTTKSPATNARLPIGAIAKVQFKAQAHQGIEVPESAVVYKGPQPLLRVVKNGTAHHVLVTLGRPRRGMVEVLKGINIGDSIVMRSSTYVADGDAVTVQNLEVAKK